MVSISSNKALDSDLNIANSMLLDQLSNTSTNYEYDLDHKESDHHVFKYDSQSIVLLETISIRNALDYVRKMNSSTEVNNIYTVNEHNILRGGFNISRLITSQLDAPIHTITHPGLISVLEGTDEQQCAELMAKHHLATLPITDNEGHLIGVVKFEDLLDVMKQDVANDMKKIVGINPNEKLMVSTFQTVKARLPWLSINLMTVLFSGLIISLFQTTLSDFIALAIFLPVIAGQSAILGTQTLTLIIRSIALKEITDSDSKDLIYSELKSTFINGLVLGLITGIIAYIWFDNIYLGILITVSMLITLLIAGLSGAIIPIVLKAAKMDPAVGSAVLVTTITDVLGFIIYLGLAALSINYLLNPF